VSASKKKQMLNKKLNYWKFLLSMYRNVLDFGAKSESEKKTVRYSNCCAPEMKSGFEAIFVVWQRF
jgi:hypothetical protein